MAEALRVALLLAAIGGCSAQRPPPPPVGAGYDLAWGAVARDAADPIENPARRAGLVRAIRARAERLRRADPEGKVPYRVLALSGGGSRGAYGAGLLTGWTASGERPEFELVTGISTGALMATAAFLGPDHDDDLRLFTEVDEPDVFEPRNLLAGILGESLVEVTPLRELVAEYIDDTVLAEVAQEYQAGRRLFIGTTNLDAGSFTVWDMGAIASSDRADRLQRYRDVILASASVPTFFPPVYIPVDSGGERYWQMHVDGSVRENVFYYEFVDEVLDVVTEMALERQDVRREMYVLHNGELYATGRYDPVTPSSISIAGASIMTLVHKNSVMSLYRLSVEALADGSDFYHSFIPPDYPIEGSPLDFDRETMQALFDFGYERAIRGDAFEHLKATRDPEQLLEMINPRVLNELEARPGFRRRDMD